MKSVKIHEANNISANKNMKYVQIYIYMQKAKTQ